MVTRAPAYTTLERSSATEMVRNMIVRAQRRSIRAQLTQCPPSLEPNDGLRGRVRAIIRTKVTIWLGSGVTCPSYKSSDELIRLHFPESSYSLNAPYIITSATFFGNSSLVFGTVSGIAATAAKPSQ
nr:hypothetical protein Iba_chr11bCG10900 [Ipomoea batatas]